MKRLIKAATRPIRLAHIARMRRVSAAKARRVILPYKNCRNCGQELKGIYCHNCGQYARDISPSLSGFAKQYFNNSFQWDGKFFRTIRTLFGHPGRLSGEWVKGRVARYVFPLKLYMSVMIVFGFCVIAYMNRGKTDEYSKSANIITSDSIVIAKVMVENSPDSTTYEQASQKLKSTPDKREELVFESSRNLMSRLPIVFMFAMPMFAIITRLFFRRRYSKYTPHLIFAIHTHTLFFIVATLGLLYSLFFTLPNWLGFIIIAYCVGYVVVGAHHFFGSGWTASLFKVLSAICVYFIFCIILFFVGFFINLYYDSLMAGIDINLKSIVLD